MVFSMVVQNHYHVMFLKATLETFEGQKRSNHVNMEVFGDIM